jgi:hypothetical protein
MFGFFGVFDRFRRRDRHHALRRHAGARSAPAGRPILSLIVFFVLGGWLLTRVDVERGRQLARNAEAKAAGSRGRPRRSDCLMSDFDYRAVFNQLVPVVEKRYGSR